MSVPHQLVRVRSQREATTTRITEADLVHALRHRQFQLSYQPQLELRTGEILGVESLVRWHRPNHGVIAPDAFLGFAEACGLIAQIDEWVIGAAAAQAVLWDELGLPPLSVAVNVSAAQFHGEGFVDRALHLIRRAKIPATRIEMEITERVIANDCEGTIETLGQLRDMGISLSIDDFGTGYSCLSELHRLAVDEIKIDRSLVHQMTKSEGVAGIVRGIIGLAHGLKLQVLAEGVETTEQLKRLLDLGCDRAQGYLIGHPLPATHVPRFIDDWPTRWHILTG